MEQIISRARKAKRPYHIVHFDGHGKYNPETGLGALAFEDDKGKNDLGDRLARRNIPLVILEACRSSDLSDRPIFGSVAPALLKSGVGSVIAFSHSVHVRAARLLVERLYSELVDGATIGQALEEARSGLHADRDRWLHRGPNPETIKLQDWFIPQLYQMGDDPVLIQPDAEPKRKIRLNLSIDIDLKDFDDRTQRLFRYGIAGFLAIPPEAVEIMDIQQGTVNVTIELPVQGGEEILRAFREKGEELAKHLSSLTLLDVSEIEKRGPILHGFPPAPMYRFHGRSMELLEIERAFRKHPAVVLSGMGGMGKTALAREAAH